jgi:hypothetical protein
MMSSEDWILTDQHGWVTGRHRDGDEDEDEVPGDGAP